MYFVGKMEKGEMGLAALPDRVQDFRMQLELSIDYANSLKCKRYNHQSCLDARKPGKKT